MSSRSRSALGAARESLEQALGQLDAAGARALGDELAAVATLLDGNFGLRRALSDDSTSAERRGELARRVLGGKVSDAAVAVVAGVSSQSWSDSFDLTAGIADLGAEAMLASADKDGRLDDVEDELFRFSRILAREPRLSLALSDPGLPADRKAGLLHRLLDDKAQPATVALIGAALTSTGGRQLDRRLDQLTVLAANRRHRLVAVVRVVRPLDEGQRDRLREALAGTYGRDVHLQVDVDPTVLGGVVVQVGDEILDGSVANRIAQARIRLGG